MICATYLCGISSSSLSQYSSYVLISRNNLSHHHFTKLSPKFIFFLQSTFEFFLLHSINEELFIDFHVPFFPSTHVQIFLHFASYADAALHNHQVFLSVQTPSLFKCLDSQDFISGDASEESIGATWALCLVCFLLVLEVNVSS